MPGPRSTTHPLPRRLRALISSLLAVSGSCALTAHAEKCPAPASLQSVPQATDGLDLDAPIELSADSFDGVREGPWDLQGNVVLRQGNRELTTTDASFDPQQNQLSTDSGVTYTDPNLKVQGTSADFDPTAGSVTFEGAQFELPSRARGSATRIHATRKGELELDDVRYTTCPLGNDDWILKASGIDIDQQAGIGSGRNVRLDFKGVPILYTPFISFPVGDQRKTGFLFPSFGPSSRSGTTITVPWYWNIAPQYDATFAPTWYSKRGARLDSEFRYLSPIGKGQLHADYLPDDQEFGDSRLFARFTDQSDFNRHLRLNLDAADVSDSRWFEDFGLGPEGTSVSYLNRSANLVYLDDVWSASMLAQNFQIIDNSIDDFDRPYTVLPQLAVRAHAPDQPFGLTLNFDGELTNFRRDDGVTGLRLDAAPEIRMPLRGPGYYLEPAASFRYTAYDLDDTAAGVNRTPRRSAPILSVDGGIGFEKNWGSGGKRLQTFEPRLMYLYVPYRNQDNLPLFDTGAPDLNPVQLYRSNRFVGADRLGNANQISVGFTSRLLDAATGQQFISGTVGQAVYFDQPRVTLPGETLDDIESSDIVAELELTAFKNWNVSMGVLWDPGETRSEKGDLNLQYRPNFDRVVNLGYRFRRQNIEQLDGSVAWPIGDHWSTYARMVYSLEDKTTLDQFAGLEYRACCWRLRLVGRRFVSNRNGDTDTSIMVQLELNGLSSVGTEADAFLERSIRGYSADLPDESD